VHVCRGAERIIAGAEPVCALSRRATAALGEIRDQLGFVDGRSLPIVSENNGRVRVWCFAGGIASASLAHALRLQGLPVSNWDDFSISLDGRTAAQVAMALAAIEVTEVRAELPADLGRALKFSQCLPDDIIRAVVEARLGDPAAVSATVSRPTKLVSLAPERNYSRSVPS
jgi:ATP-dependent helicase Lhr and Lhr-like helicase